jgi:hypothetical protein
MSKSLATGSVPVRPEELDEAQRATLVKYDSWARFHSGPRQWSKPLLAAAHRYERSIYVAGCQRSGTTMLTRIVAGADGFRPLALTRDDELDAALALCGLIRLPAGTRYAFQTTYLNERYREYADAPADARLIWMIRNPYSVVFSMLHHWRRAALDRLHSGLSTLSPAPAKKSGVLGVLPGTARIAKACNAYALKTGQVREIRSWLPASRLMVVDYDDLIRDPSTWFRAIFEFAETPFRDSSLEAIRSDRRHLGDRLSGRARALVEELALPVYEECRSLIAEPARA